MLASIPSPPSNVIELGPITLRAYGLMIAFGVMAAVRALTAAVGRPRRRS
jgi:prolipoprotein diacylglyceryltransferase